MRPSLRAVPLLGSLLPLLLLSLAFFAAAGTARAQLKLGVETERMNYLLYEAIPLRLTIENAAGFDLSFADAGEKPWLSFYITREDGSVVAPDRKAAREPLLLAAGKRTTLAIDLTPLYAMRATGRYKVQAVIDLADREYLSSPLFITLVPGRRCGGSGVRSRAPCGPIPSSASPRR